MDSVVFVDLSITDVSLLNKRNTANGVPLGMSGKVSAEQRSPEAFTATDDGEIQMAEKSLV